MSNRLNLWLCLLLVLCAVPAGVLLLSYGAISIHMRNPWPWLELVHESGDRTLVGTILYFDHAARELPLDLILGLGVGGSAAFALGGARPQPWRPTPSALGTALLLVCALIVGGTLGVGGFTAVSDNLLQMHSRPGTPLSWGAHWRYHLLSRFMLMLLSIGFAGLIVRMSRGPAGKGYKQGLTCFGSALLVFGILTVAFVPNSDPFTDAISLGHQAREAFTHIALTLPASWAMCLFLAGNNMRKVPDGNVPIRKTFVSGGVGVLIGLFLLLGAVSTSAVSQGQTSSIVLLVFPHFFEHFFSLLVVALAAGLVYRLSSAETACAN